MLAICTDTLPQTCLSYLAFRLSFLETLERIAMARQIGDDELDCFGYLTEVPFLRSVPPHVQLDLLAETWSKHVACERIDADLVDEAVIYTGPKSVGDEGLTPFGGEGLDRLVKNSHFTRIATRSFGPDRMTWWRRKRSCSLASSAA